MDDLDRLHDRLVANVRDGFPHLLERTFRLGDIPEHLVPYRTNRPSLRFDSARQYELALMRLASGERGYLRVEPVVADAFRRALAAPEPDAAVLRDHGMTSVALGTGAVATTATHEAPAPAPTPAPAPASSPAPLPAPPASAVPGPYDAPSLEPSWPPPVMDGLPGTRSQAPTPMPTPMPTPVPTTGPDVVPPLRDPRAPSFQSEPGPTAMGGPCRYCGHALPEGREVTYCPNCGQNVTVRHCPACSTELEMGWRFCITCGRAMDDAALHAEPR